MHCTVVSAQLRLCANSYLCSTNALDMVEGWLQHMPIAIPHVLILTHASGQANLSKKCDYSCQKFFMHVCSVAQSDRTISTKVYTTCSCMTSKKHRMQCTVSSWHCLNKMCQTCVLLCLQVPRHILLSINSINLAQLGKQTHHEKCHTYKLCGSTCAWPAKFSNSVCLSMTRRALFSKKNFYACRRSRVQARSNPGTGDQGGRCTTCI